MATHAGSRPDLRSTQQTASNNDSSACKALCHVHEIMPVPSPSGKLMLCLAASLTHRHSKDALLRTESATPIRWHYPRGLQRTVLLEDDPWLLIYHGEGNSPVQAPIAIHMCLWTIHALMRCPCKLVLQTYTTCTPECIPAGTTPRIQLLAHTGTQHRPTRYCSQHAKHNSRTTSNNRKHTRPCTYQ